MQKTSERFVLMLFCKLLLFHGGMLMQKTSERFVLMLFCKLLLFHLHRGWRILKVRRVLMLFCKLLLFHCVLRLFYSSHYCCVNALLQASAFPQQDFLRINGQRCSVNALLQASAFPPNLKKYYLFPLFVLMLFCKLLLFHIVDPETPKERKDVC